MSEQWVETCRCGASIKLTGWMYSNTEKAALEWRKNHRCKNPHINTLKTKNTGDRLEVAQPTKTGTNKMHPLHLLVHQFTREHIEHIENPDGTNEYVKVHSYLTQLEHAKNANRGTGTTSGGGRVPVSLVAVDLLIEIEKTTNRNQPTDW